MYSVDDLRKEFPILSRNVYGRPLVYLDNGASAQKPRQVLDRMRDCYESEYANVHRGLHYLANAATEGYEGARETVAKFLNAPRKEEVIFTRNANAPGGWQLTNWVALDAQNGRTTVRLTNQRYGVAVADSAFTFKDPRRSTGRR